MQIQIPPALFTPQAPAPAADAASDPLATARAGLLLPAGLDEDRVRDAVVGPLRDHDLAAAVTALAALLPRRDEGEELPDIVHE